MKTVICDIDGTLTKYMGGGHKAIMDNDHEACPGVVDKMREWEAQGHRIILMTYNYPIKKLENEYVNKRNLAFEFGKKYKEKFNKSSIAENILNILK